MPLTRATAELTYVNVDPAAAVSRPLPEPVAAALRRLLPQSV
jgi:hypothetical protein